MKAIWHNVTIAESDHTVVIEGNHYFPPESLNKACVLSSNHHTMCSLKGQASYYDLFVDGNVNPIAAWFYPDPKEAALHIKDHVAFWKGVQVTE